MAARGPTARGIAKRDEILDVATEIYAQHGYDRTSVREVARRSNLTQAGLLHYFASKQDLFIAVLRRRDVRVTPTLTAPHHSVRALFEAVGINEHEPDLVRLFVNMSAESTDGDSPSRGFFSERYDWLRSDIAADVRAMQAAGEFDASHDGEEIATILIALADGLQLQWLLDPSIPMLVRMQQVWARFARAPVPLDS